MEQAESIPSLLQHTAIMLYRQSDQVLQERLGIGMSQLKLLTMLEQDPNARQRKIADALGQTEASVSRQVKLLAGKGYLKVGINPKSRREHIAEITPKGLKITEAAKETLDACTNPIEGSLTDKQRKQLAAILTSLHQRICVPGRPFACDQMGKAAEDQQS